MNRYLVLLGRKQDLAAHELQTVLQRESHDQTSIEDRIEHAAVVRTAGELDVHNLINTLGGTVKIAKVGRKLDTRDFIGELTGVLRNEAIGKGKLTFSVSIIGNADPRQTFLIPRTLKSRLDEEGVASRYVLPRQGSELSSVQVAKQNVVELYLVWQDDGILVAKTLVVQDFEGFSRRDYGRPHAHPQKGMLPPKVARMMVNLAFPSPLNPTIWLLDPFCGTGTVLMEALMLGVNAIGGDHDQVQVDGARKNLTWLTGEEEINAKWRIERSDATQISKKLAGPVDAVVTEPFLGPAMVREGKVRDIVKGLDKLYLGALKDWHGIVKPHGRVVMVIPEFKVGKLVKSADLIIDRCENVGYTLVAGLLDYERPQAKVRRKIAVFEKK